MWPSVYFIISDHASGQGAASVREPVDSIQSLAVDSDVEPSVSHSSCQLIHYLPFLRADG